MQVPHRAAVTSTIGFGNSAGDMAGRPTKWVESQVGTAGSARESCSTDVVR